MNKVNISVYVALFIVLLIGVTINLLPILSIIPPTQHELTLLSKVDGMKGSNLDVVLSSLRTGNIVEYSYIYIVNLIVKFFGESSIFFLRLPSAIIAGLLTLSLFRFDGVSERLGKSFIASLIFMACAYMSVLCYHASPVMLPSIFTVLSFSSFYRWLRRPSYRNALIVSITLGINIILTGTLAILFLAVVGTVFLGTTRIGNIKNWIVFISSIIFGAILCFIAIFIITGDKGLAYSALESFEILNSLDSTNTSVAFIFTTYIIIALFPWSVPISISLPWLARHIKYVYHKCLELSLLNRFGISIFILSLPFFFFYSYFSFVLLLTSVFFNAPLIGKILIHQFHHYPTTWRITGIICGVIAGVGTILFAILNMNISLFGISLIKSDWSAWSIFLIFAIACSIYTLWRNDREIGRNNRYFFNIIILYLLFQNLMIGYIIPNITI